MWPWSNPKQKHALTDQQELEVIELYRQGWSIPELANKHGVSPGAIRNIFTRRGEPVRKKTLRTTPAKTYWTKKEEEEVVSLYRSGLALRAVARRFGTSVTPIIRVLDKHGVERRSTRLWTPEQEEKLADMYRSGFRTPHIAKVLSVSETAVKDALKRQGIAMLGAKGRKRLSKQDEQDIIYQYGLGVSGRTLAKEYGAQEWTIYDILRKAGIERRSRGAGATHRRGSLLLSREEEQEVVEAYRSGMTMDDIAEVLDVGRDVVRKTLIRHGVARRSRRSFTPTQDKEVSAAYGQGASLQDLADAYSVSSTTIKKAILRAGGKIRESGWKLRQKKGLPQVHLHAIKPDDVPYLARLYREGRTPKELAEMFDVHPATIRATLKRHGYEVRPVGVSKVKPGELHLITGLEPQLVEDYIEGMTEEQLVQKYAITPREVREAIERHMASKMRKAENPDFDAPIGLLAAASVAALAFGIWGWATRTR